MNYVGRMFSSVRGYIGINHATLTGAIDIIVIRQEDGSYITSPWHVRFGKMGVIRAKQKVVDIEINGEPVDLHMKLGEAGEAFFVEEAENIAEVPSHLATSPLEFNSLDMMEKGLVELKELSAIDQQSDLLTPVIEQSGGMVITIEGTSPVVSVLPKAASLAQSLPESGLFGSVMEDFHRQHPLLKLNEASTQTDLKRTGAELQQCHFLDNVMMEQDAQLRIVKSSVELRDETSQSLLTNVATEQMIFEDSAPRKIFAIDPDNISDIESQSPDATQTGISEVSQSERLNNRTAAAGIGSDECLFEMELDDLDHGDGPTMLDRRATVPLMQRNQFFSIYQSFSDTDLTPVASPSTSRPASPKSDTELDIRNDASSQTHLNGDRVASADDLLWKWGEFPESSSTTTKYLGKKETKQKADDLRNTSKVTLPVSKLPSGGIYLDDLKQEEMDPELIGLYLYDYRSPPKSVEEDRESGRGVSLPQSPVTVQMDPLDVMGTESSGIAQQIAHLDLAMSLCGAFEEQDSDVFATKFQQHLISFEALCNNPNIFTDPNLIIRLSGKYYKWQVAGPLIMSLLVFNKPVKDRTLDALMKQHMPKKEQRKRGWLWWGGKETTTACLPNNSHPDKLESTISKDAASSAPSSQASSPPQSPEKIKDRSASLVKENSSFESDAENIALTVGHNKSSSDVKEHVMKEKYIKSLKLSSEQIAKLNLNDGANEATFSVTTQYQGTTRCMCHIFLWNWNDKIVVSDIDGTITKSDVLGQVLPMIGQVLPYINNDWSQVGIARLYSMIASNGYKFLYLSARAIGQSKLTRDYLRSIRQADVSLPDGPLLLSPSSLVSAFHKEVIERKPEEFKISCLKDIKELFPSCINPFLAGFGNKINDVWAYTTIGIPTTRIFTVNPKGQLRIETLHSFESSYTRLSDIVDHFFPPLDSQTQARNPPYNNEFNTFSYWRDPLPNIEDELAEFQKRAVEEKKEKNSDKKAKPSKIS